MLVILHNPCKGVVEMTGPRAALCHSCGKEIMFVEFKKDLSPRIVPRSLIENPPELQMISNNKEEQECSDIEERS